MDKLLAWSVAQQSGDQEAIEKVGKPDEKLLSQLFGGPDEPTLMKQSFIIINDKTVSENDKVVALENFEMLIENLDNANNIENLKLWPSVIGLLDPEQPEEFRLLATSIIGIAVQNNNKAQTDFLKYPQGFESLIKYATDDLTKLNLKLKLLFAISSVISNNLSGFTFFIKLNGWKIFESVNDNSKWQLRLLSLISSILSNTKEFKSEIEPKLHHLHLVSLLINNLANDVNHQEKALQNVCHLIDLNYKFDNDELTALKSKANIIRSLKDHYPKDVELVETVL